MKRIILFLSFIMLIGCNDQATVSTLSLSSPDESIAIKLSSGDELTYQVSYNEKDIISPSKLGFEFKDMKPLKSFEIIDSEMTAVNETWQPVWGQNSSIVNHYNELKVFLKEINGSRTMNLYFRAFDDGIGFRYEIPSQEGIEKIEVMDELTEFSFTEDATAWWIRNDWDSYEYLYKETALSDINSASTPVTMKLEDGTHISVHEASLVDYSGMALERSKGLTFESHLAPWPDGSKVKLEGSLVSPWRTIQIGDSAGDLAESSMILNLNEPTEYADTSWIKPMKYMGIWWEMHIKKSDWGRHNNNHGATTENAKYYIDFIDKYLSSEEQPIGLLVEGWNQGWDGNWIENYDLFKFTEDGEYEDFDVSEVVSYGKERHVEYIMHNETSGGIENYDSAMDDAYSDYQRLGIHAIKSGYVADGGMKQPRGQHHHGQYMVNHYNQAVEKAADYEIMINTHEPIKATGLSRTYPNWVAREGVQGMEYNAWSAGNPPEHTTIIPFTRILGGPIDYTPGIFDVEIGGAVNRVHTTRAKQLALYVVLYSPLQMVTDLPENFLDENGEIYPEFKFVKDVALDWDETHVLGAEIGDFVTIARKTKGKDEWFIGSITDEERRELDVSLDFLDDQLYTAEIYTDAVGTDYLESPNNVSSYKVVVSKDDVLRLSLAAGGGTAIRLSVNEDPSIQRYTYSDLEIGSFDMPDTISSNDSFSSTVKVTNNSSITVGKVFPFYINDELIYEKYMRIPPRESMDLEFSYDLFYEPGEYLVKIGDFEPRTLTVTHKEATFEYEDFEVFTNGNKLMTRLKVTNTGYEAGEITLSLMINGEFVEERTLEIESAPGGKTKGVTFRYDMLNSGTYIVSVNGLEYELEHTLQ